MSNTAQTSISFKEYSDQIKAFGEKARAKGYSILLYGEGGDAHELNEEARRLGFSCVVPENATPR